MLDAADAQHQEMLAVPQLIYIGTPGKIGDMYRHNNDSKIDYRKYVDETKPTDNHVHEELSERISLQPVCDCPILVMLQVLLGHNEPQLKPFSENFWCPARQHEIANPHVRTEGFSPEFANYSMKHPAAVFNELAVAQAKEAERCTKFKEAHFLVACRAHAAISRRLPRVPMRIGTLVDMNVLLNTGGQCNTISTHTLFKAITRCQEWANAFRTCVVVRNAYIVGDGNVKHAVYAHLMMRVDFSTCSAPITFAIHEGATDQIIMGIKGLEALNFKFTNTTLTSELDYLKIAQQSNQQLSEELVRRLARSYLCPEAPLLYDSIVKMPAPEEDEGYLYELTSNGVQPRTVCKERQPLANIQFLDKKYKSELWQAFHSANSKEEMFDAFPTPDQIEMTYWSEQRYAEETIGLEAEGIHQRRFGKETQNSLWGSDES